MEAPAVGTASDGKVIVSSIANVINSASGRKCNSHSDCPNGDPRSRECWLGFCKVCVPRQPYYCTKNDAKTGGMDVSLFPNRRVQGIEFLPVGGVGVVYEEM